MVRNNTKTLTEFRIMKLITEVSEDIKYFAEEKDGKRSLFIEGVFLQSNLKNRNGRVYPKEIMRKEVDRYRSEVSIRRELWESWDTQTGQL